MWQARPFDQYCMTRNLIGAEEAALSTKTLESTKALEEEKKPPADMLPRASLSQYFARIIPG